MRSQHTSWFVKNLQRGRRKGKRRNETVNYANNARIFNTCIIHYKSKKKNNSLLF